MTKLLVLDKDGTLVRPKSDNTFVQHPEDQELIEGVSEAIARYVADGWQVAIASNQGGVASNFKSLDSAIAEMQYALKLTGLYTAAIAHSNEDKGYGEFAMITRTSFQELTHGDKFRKPNAGMLNYFCHYFSVGLSDKKLMIGDRAEDQGAATAAGFDFMWAHEWIAQNS